MTELIDRINALADGARGSDEAHDEGKAVVVELTQIAKKRGERITGESGDRVLRLVD